MYTAVWGAGGRFAERREEWCWTCSIHLKRQLSSPYAKRPCDRQRHVLTAATVIILLLLISLLLLLFLSMSTATIHYSPAHGSWSSGSLENRPPILGPFSLITYPNLLDATLKTVCNPYFNNTDINVGLIPAWWNQCFSWSTHTLFLIFLKLLDKCVSISQSVYSFCLA